MTTIPTPKNAGINRIPPEILGEIFIHCPPTNIASQITPHVLSSVCRLWRIVTLATPALWASLDITCDIFDLHPPLSIVHTHLERSKTRPLFFKFVLHPSPIEYLFEDNPHLLPSLTALAAARERWCNVQIKLAWLTREILDLITPGNAPLLQSMQFHVIEGEETLPIPLRMLHHSPRLESFQWNSSRSSLLLPLVDVTSLTILSLEAMLHISECVTLLRLCPRLSSARFDTLYSSPPPIPRLTHPALQTLSAIGERCAMFLAALTLPSLLNLNLAIGYTFAPLPTGWEVVLSTFLDRSTPPLRTLSLCMPHMRRLEPALPGILARTPNLRCLKLEDYERNSPALSAALIRALHPPPPPDAPLCPLLQRLDLFRVTDCPDGLYTAMLRARWGAQARSNGVACLEWAHIKLVGGVHDRDRADIRELWSEGM